MRRIAVFAKRVARLDSIELALANRGFQADETHRSVGLYYGFVDDEAFNAICSLQSIEVFEL